MIQAEKVSFAYRGSGMVIKELDLWEDQGRCLALLGNNGVGKSTFLKCINRILEPREGVIVVDGMNITNTSRLEIARKIAYVEQHTETNRLTVYDMILIGRKPHMRFAPRREDFEIVDSVISRMHLEELKLRYIDELSGGELQKVVLARALAQQPKVLLLDEPTASLDLKNQHEVMSIVSQIAYEDNMTAVVVIHDLNLALKYCDRFLLLREGKAYRYGDSSIITSDAIRDVYGVESSIVELDGTRFVIVH